MDFNFLGEVLSDDRRIVLRKMLIEKLAGNFFADRSDSIPISCRFIPSKSADNLEEKWFSDGVTYIVYMENYEVMILSDAKNFLKFLNEREPWQDYDVCIFDENLTFCVALTHNDEVKVIDF